MLTSNGQGYHKWGNGEKTLLMLHGWPGDSSKWQAIAQILQDKFTIYAIDAAGWGETKLKKEYTLDNYSQDVLKFIQELKIEKPVIIGHSFGGRVAIKFLIMYPEVAEKLILIASAGIERKGLKVKILALLSKFSPIFVKKMLRLFFASKDYQNLNGEMRKTFKNVVNENLENFLPKINIPTLLIWGDLDHTTPLWQGKLMAKLIPNSKLIIVRGANHGLPYRVAGEAAGAIQEFLK